MKENIVPTISSSVSGPIGLQHLPRLWQKLLLHAVGRLPEGYRHGTGGFDETLCTSIGVDRDAMIEYVTSQKPSYLQFEAWISEHATQLDSESIAAYNKKIAAHNMPDAMAETRRKELGIEHGSITRAITLNDLDDWAAFHRSLENNDA